MSLFLRAALPIALAGLVSIGSARAADYDPPIVIDDADEYVPVEVGSGWYLRGDIGYKINKPYRDVNMGADPFIVQESNTMPVTGSVGFGYRFTDYFRMEANIGLMMTDSSKRVDTSAGIASPIVETTSNEMWTGMVNAYADLGTFVGFTPYIGGGVGLAASTRKYHLTDTGVSILRDSASQYTFAYSLGAGVNYALTNDLSVDLGYEYFSAPNAEYITLLGPSSYRVNNGIDYHQIKLGLRYALW